MKKQLFFASCIALSALLAACGSQGAVTPPPSLSVSVTGTTNLKIDTVAQLAAVVKDAEGNALTGTSLAWTSSDPSVVSVDLGGKLTARHLSVRPVTITASADGKSDSVNVTTYGFDALGGTYNDTATNKIGTYFLFQFRDQAGKGLPEDTRVSMTGPRGFANGQTLSFFDLTAAAVDGDSSYTTNPAPNLAPVTGQYKASFSLGGTTYTKTFSIDASSILGGVKDASTKLTARDIQVNGVPAAGTVRLYANVLATFPPSSTPSFSLKDLPYAYTWPTPLAIGTYQTEVRAYNFDRLAGGALPEQVNASSTKTADVTLTPDVQGQQKPSPVTSITGRVQYGFSEPTTLKLTALDAENVGNQTVLSEAAIEDSTNFTLNLPNEAAMQPYLYPLEFRERASDAACDGSLSVSDMGVRGFGFDGLNVFQNDQSSEVVTSKIVTYDAASRTANSAGQRWLYADRPVNVKGDRTCAYTQGDREFLETQQVNIVLLEGWNVLDVASSASADEQGRIVTNIVAANGQPSAVTAWAIPSDMGTGMQSQSGEAQTLKSAARTALAHLRALQPSAKR